LAVLPEQARRQARAAYELFRNDPFHPSLQFKPISPRDPRVYSVRIGLHYRAMGVRKTDRIVWYWIGTHANYDRELQRHDD
jgi:hypothetical protein